MLIYYKPLVSLNIIKELGFSLTAKIYPAPFPERGMQRYKLF
jgi:hypothetical protein